MKLGLMAAVLWFTFLNSAMAHQFEPIITYTEDQAISAFVIHHLAEGNDQLALDQFERFFKSKSQRRYLLRSDVFLKLAVVQALTRHPVWLGMRHSLRVEFVKIALKYGPLSSRYERDLAFYLAKAQTLESMAALIHLTQIPTESLIPDSAHDGVMSKWQRRFYRTNRFGYLLKHEINKRIDPIEIGRIVSSWAKKFDGPDELIHLVNKDTSVEALRAIKAIIASRPDWVEKMSPVQSNRLQFWNNLRRCESGLTGPKS